MVKCGLNGCQDGRNHKVLDALFSRKSSKIIEKRNNKKEVIILSENPTITGCFQHLGLRQLARKGGKSRSGDLST